MQERECPGCRKSQPSSAYRPRGKGGRGRPAKFCLLCREAKSSARVPALVVTRVSEAGEVEKLCCSCGAWMLAEGNFYPRSRDALGRVIAWHSKCLECNRTASREYARRRREEFTAGDA